MSKTAKDNIIQINGEKFKALLEGATGKTLKEISLENGFSDSFLRMVVKTCKASPSAQAVAKLYGIEPSAYEVKPETVAETLTDDRQLSIDDLLGDDAKVLLKAYIKDAVREAVMEIFNGFRAKEIRSEYDPVRRTFNLSIDVINSPFASNNKSDKDPDMFSI